jgi:ATP-dependent DNA helicase RecQ
MNGEDTIGLLPTGGGKSLTYQICALLQPALSFVVVPLKSLMVDQVESVSSKHGISHTTYINSDLNPEIAKKRLRDFTLGKYFYLLITPEKLQNKYFRSEFEQLNETKAISIAVIDEAHCLSEWGHDFRTSYLALSNTINRIITPSPRYLALTATASSKVLQDLMNELNISSQNVLTIPDFSRSELEFEIIPVEKTLRNNKLLELIQISKTQNSVKSGTLVFTHNVKGKEGCYQISELIHNLTGLTTSFYSGSQPLNWEKNNGIKFEKFKDDVQKKFMSDEIDVLVATKSFGMGIDKGNIRLTVHYGLPASLESFYQEAGRAGRDKKKSYCKVLYTPDNLSDSDIDILFGVDSSPTNFKEVSKKLRGDLKNIMFFMGKNIIDIKLEAKTIFDFYISITTKNKNNSTLKFLYSDDIEQERFEKYIYKLTLVGVFDDWSVDFNAKYFEITPSLKTESDLTNHLIRYIQKYDYTFDLNDQHSENHRVLYDYFNNIEEPIILKLLYLLLKWTNDNVLYSRKRSMLLMKEFADNFKSSKELQEKVEQYFKRNDDVYFLEKIVGKREKLKEWFRIFFVSEAGKEDVVKSNQSVNELKITLNRFLESYDNDIALNMINGFLNLLTDDFDNRDGRQRLSKSLKEIHQMNSIVRNEIFNTILL